MTTNLRLVLRTYSALRQMSPDDIALLETLRALNDNDRELLVEMMTDKPAGKKASKKPSKKSARASSLGAAVKGRLQQREPTVGGFADDADMFRCTAMIDDNGGERECGETVDNNVHHKRTDPNYHPFQSSSAVSSADNQSPANGESSATVSGTRRSAPPSTPESGDGEGRSASLSAVDSEASAASAGAATGGSSE